MNKETYKVETTHIDYNRIFLLSDTHFGVRSNSLEWLENNKNYFVNFYIPFLKENVKPGDIFFFLGDWFDNRQLLDIYVMNTSIDIIMEIASILPVKMITGNHDIYKKNDTDINSISAFRYIPNVTIYEKPVIVSNNKSSILVLPWIGDPQKEEQYINSNKYDYIFAHTYINGLKRDNNTPISKGINVIEKSGNFKRLISGHIHKRQEFKNLLYIGSPYHTKRSDIGNTKGMYILNTENNKIEFTKNTFSPIFQKVLLETILNLKMSDVVSIFNNNYTDILIPDKFIHLFNLSHFINELSGCNYKKIEVAGEVHILPDQIDELNNQKNIDIFSLIELSIDDLEHQSEVLVKLKVLNKKYYNKALNNEN